LEKQNRKLTYLGTQKGGVRMSNKNKIEEWLESSEGQKALEKSRQTTDEIVAELRRARCVDRETLERPFGPVDGGRVWPHQR
jgi:hypothetical protein